MRNLVKRLGDKLVLNGFNLTVERGETCVIIGGSGTGKSTFARLLVGLLRADSGEMRVDGLNIVGLGEGDLERVRRKFAFVFQSSALLDSMSVFDNVAFPLREARQLSRSAPAHREPATGPLVALVLAHDLIHSQTRDARIAFRSETSAESSSRGPSRWTIRRSGSSSAVNYEIVTRRAPSGIM